MVDSISWDELIESAGDSVASSFEPLPEDNYDMEIVEASYTKSKASGYDMWKVQAKVVGGKYNNRRLFDNIVLTADNEKALPFFFRKMSALGLGIEYFKTNPGNEAIATALKGRRFVAKVGTKTYQGELQNEIKQYKAAPGGAVQSGPGAPAAPVPPPAASVPAYTPAPAPSPAPAPAVPQATTPTPPSIDGLPF